MYFDYGDWEDTYLYLPSFNIVTDDNPMGTLGFYRLREMMEIPTKPRVRVKAVYKEENS